jgi:hypothetical protein
MLRVSSNVMIGLSAGVLALVGNRQERAVQMGSVFVEHLHDVSVGRRIGQLEYIGSGWQNLARNLNWTAEGEDGLPVRFVGSGARDHARQESKADLEKRYRPYSVHFYLL